MDDYRGISLDELIPLPVQRKIGVNNIRGDTLSRIIKRAFEHTTGERILNSNSYKCEDNKYYIYKLNKVIEVTSDPYIKGLTYTPLGGEFIKFNKPIPPKTEVFVKFTKKFDEQSDSFRYYARQYYDKPVINYLVTFFSNYLSDTPQDKITEATLITYINNYKKE